MTVRWVTGKRPTVEDVKGVITNSISRFIDLREVDKIARAIVKFYEDRVEGRK